MIKVKDNSQWVEVTEIKDLFSFLKSVSGPTILLFCCWSDNKTSLFFQIDFRDPWLIVLMGFHMIITTLTLMTRRNCNVQVFLFLVLSKSRSQFLSNWFLVSIHWTHSIDRLIHLQYRWCISQRALTSTRPATRQNFRGSSTLIATAFSYPSYSPSRFCSTV